MKVLSVGKVLTEAAALTNCVYVHPDDIPASAQYLLVNKRFAFTLARDGAYPRGSLGCNTLHRHWARLSLNEQVQVELYNPMDHTSSCFIKAATLEVAHMKKSISAPFPFDADEMAAHVHRSFNKVILTQGQTFAFEFKGFNLQATVLVADLTDVAHLDAQAKSPSPPLQSGDATSRGILVPESRITFTKAADSTIKLVGSIKSTIHSNQIIKPDFKFEDMGIGGLDEEFGVIFRRAFSSRVFPPAVAQKLGMPHVKGMLLYGPPGTGKTLIARQIGSTLNARPPKIVNGPEILNKYVGQSEENIRNLFADAEAEYKARKEESQLHVIIFDELDAICKQRGGKADGTGVGDNVVNQLLSKMDGVDSLDNILVIGMTNRLDLIDEALLRPGRFEVHVEIGLPDEAGRAQILKIHTAKMAKNGVLAADVDLAELAALTKNYSGAELTGVLKAASSFALTRHIKVGTFATPSDDIDNMKLCREDFMNALTEVKPAYGVAYDDLEAIIENGIISYNEKVEGILSNVRSSINLASQSGGASRVVVLLHGPPESGKSALAAKLALESGFPFIRMIRSKAFIGLDDLRKATRIEKIFEDAYKSPLSCIFIDCIEDIIDYVPVGPRFSTPVLKALCSCISNPPKSGHKIFILATTSDYSALDNLKITERFKSTVYVPNLEDLSSVMQVIKTSGLFEEQEQQDIEHHLRLALQNASISIGVGRLFFIMQTAKASLEEKAVDSFMAQILDAGYISSITSKSSPLHF